MNLAKRAESRWNLCQTVLIVRVSQVIGQSKLHEYSFLNQSPSYQNRHKSARKLTYSQVKFVFGFARDWSEHAARVS